MAQLIMVVLDDLEPLPDLLAAWRAIGVPGATILESVGAHRAESWLSRVGLGMLGHLFEADEVRRRTLLAAVADDLAGRAVAEAERVVGGFGRPESGILLVLPVIQVLGLSKPANQAEAKEVAAPSASVRRTSVLACSAVHNTPPTLVQIDTPIPEVIQAIIRNPQAEVACVLGEMGHLVGLIEKQALADSLFVHVFPEEFLSEISDLQEVMRFADRTRARTAGDVMRSPVWVTPEDDVETAFRRMHEQNVSGLPIVDHGQKVIAYVSVLALLAVISSGEESGGAIEESGG